MKKLLCWLGIHDWTSWNDTGFVLCWRYCFRCYKGDFNLFGDDEPK